MIQTNITLDDLQILFWGFSYVLIILSGFFNITMNYNNYSIPHVAVVANIAWEICAISHSISFWGHALWLGLDIMIFTLNYWFIKYPKNRMIYLLSAIILSCLLSIVFKHTLGMVISVFIIDLIMSISFIVSLKHISPYARIPIAIAKLLGDTFAGIYYGQDAIFIAIIAILVFIINLAYLYMCIKKYILSRNQCMQNKTAA